MSKLSISFDNGSRFVSRSGREPVSRVRPPGSSGTRIFYCLLAAFFIVGCAEDVYIDSAGGKHWIVIEPPHIVYYESIFSLAEAYDGAVIAGTSSGIFRSFTRGAVWEHIENGLNLGPPVRAIARGEGGMLFAGLHPGGVFISTDNGSSWRQVNNHLTNINVGSLALNSSGHLFAGTDGGEIFVSTDYGGVWSPCGSDLMSTDIYALAVDSSDVLFAGCRGDGVFKSPDNGLSWIEVNDGLLNRRVWDFAVAPDGRVFASTDFGGIFGMEEGSDIWVQVGAGVTELDVCAIAIGPDGSVLAGTDGDGVLVSRDGGDTWEKTGYGISGKDVISIIYSSGAFFAAGRYSGLFRSVDYGETWFTKGWQRIGSGELICTGPGGALFVGTGDGLFVSYDEGTSWIRADDRIYCHVQDLAVHPDGYILAVWGVGLYRSGDGCRTWERVSIRDTDEPPLYKVEIDSAGTIYTGNGEDGVFRSDDAGQSWEDIGVQFENGYYEWNLDYIALKPDGTVFVVCAGDIFRNLDGTWDKLEGSVRSIDIDSKGAVFISNSECVMRSYDNGDSWECVGTDVIRDPYDQYPRVNVIISRNDHILAWSRDGFLFHSVDGGDTWYEDGYEGFGGKLYPIHDAAFGADHYVYILGYFRIYRSSAPDY